MSQFRRYPTSSKRGPFIAVAIAAAVAAALLVPQNAFAATASPAAATAPARTSALTVAQMTQVVWQDTDDVRAQAGKPVLVRNSALDKVAADWAKQQFANGGMSHNPNYSSQIPAGWQHAGENVAAGYSYSQVVDAWVASSSHYANLVNDYTDIGIGYYEQDGKRYWSQVFAKYPSTKTPARTAAPAASTPAGSTAPAPTKPATSGAEPAAPAGAVIPLTSPSFEGSTSGWSGSRLSLVGPISDAKGGRYALSATGSTTVAQTVSVAGTVGETYTATLWVRPGSTSAVKGTAKLSTVGGSTETSSVSFSVSGSWMKVSVPLRITKAGHTGITVSIVLPSGSYQIDSVSLVRTTAAPAAATAAPATAPAASSTPAPSKSPASTTPASAPAAAAPAPAPAPLISLTPAPAPSSSSAPSRSPGLVSGLVGGLLG